HAAVPQYLAELVVVTGEGIRTLPPVHLYRELVPGPPPPPYPPGPVLRQPHRVLADQSHPRRSRTRHAGRRSQQRSTERAPKRDGAGPADARAVPAVAEPCGARRLRPLSPRRASGSGHIAAEAACHD